MEVKINKVYTGEFQKFIEKLIAVDSFVFMKMNDRVVSSAVYLPQRDAVKLVSINIEDIFEFDEPLKNPIKVSFYNASRIIDALKFFAETDLTGKIVYDKIGDDYIASDFILKSSKMTMKLFCADPSLSFMDMSKDEIGRAFNTDNGIFKFTLTKGNLSDIKKFFKFDKDNETYKLEIKNKKLKIIGENYNSVLSDEVEILDESIDNVTLYKKYLPLIDKEENYTAIMCSNKMFLKSQDTNTMLIIALCMLNED